MDMYFGVIIYCGGIHKTTLFNWEDRIILSVLTTSLSLLRHWNTVERLSWIFMMELCLCPLNPSSSRMALLHCQEKKDNLKWNFGILTHWLSSLLSYSLYNTWQEAWFLISFTSIIYDITLNCKSFPCSSAVHRLMACLYLMYQRFSLLEILLL